MKPAQADMSRFQLVDVTSDVTQRLANAVRIRSFATTLGEGRSADALIGSGDVIDVSIWEAPPAMLFGAAGLEMTASSSSSAPGGARATSFPEQMVNRAGDISIPFLGAVHVAGRSTQAVQADIVRRLRGKAHDPQVIVRVIRNATTTVTVVGEVNNSLRMPLTSRGEHLLDALGAAGGVRQPVGKMTIQITRGNVLETMPLDAVIRDPRQNILLQPNDVVTALFQPYSFTVLGATSLNQELNFEGTGLTLAQAMGRVGGLQDQRANPRGVFIFRYEDPATLEPGRLPIALSQDGRVPTIYHVDMKKPESFFLAQNFQVRDKDILYVSNAPLADVQKFVSILSSAIVPASAARTIAP